MRTRALVDKHTELLRENCVKLLRENLCSCGQTYKTVSWELYAAENRHIKLLRENPSSWRQAKLLRDNCVLFNVDKHTKLLRENCVLFSVNKLTKLLRENSCSSGQTYTTVTWEPVLLWTNITLWTNIHNCFVITECSCGQTYKTFTWEPVLLWTNI